MLSSPINSYIPDVIVSVSTLKETQLFKKINISFITIPEIEGAIKKIVPFIFLYFYVIIIVEKNILQRRYGNAPDRTSYLSL